MVRPYRLSVGPDQRWCYGGAANRSNGYLLYPNLARYNWRSSTGAQSTAAGPHCTGDTIQTPAAGDNDDCDPGLVWTCGTSLPTAACHRSFCVSCGHASRSTRCARDRRTCGYWRCPSAAKHPTDAGRSPGADRPAPTKPVAGACLLRQPLAPHSLTRCGSDARPARRRRRADLSQHSSEDTGKTRHIDTHVRRAWINI